MLKPLFHKHLPFNHEENLIKRWMKLKGDLFIDVGAGIGSYCINLSSCFKEVWAFEPLKETRATLLKNIRRYQITNIKVYPHAIGNKIDVKHLHQSRNYASKLTAGFLKEYLIICDEVSFLVRCPPCFRKMWTPPETRRILENQAIIDLCKRKGNVLEATALTQNLGPVLVTTLNEVVGPRHVDFIKVDVEGFEQEVLQGASEIARNVKLWQIEVHDPETLPFFHRKLAEWNYPIIEERTSGEEHWIIAKREDVQK